MNVRSARCLSRSEYMTLHVELSRLLRAEQHNWWWAGHLNALLYILTATLWSSVISAVWQWCGKYYNCHRYLLQSKSWLGSIACSMKINMNQYLSFWPLQNSNRNKNAFRIFCALEVSLWDIAYKYWEMLFPNISGEHKLGWKSAAQLYTCTGSGCCHSRKNCVFCSWLKIAAKKWTNAASINLL